MTKRLLYLNGLAILMIPLEHASAYGMQNLFFFFWTALHPGVDVPNFSLLGSLPFHVFTVLRQFSAFSVPSFLFISGFFISFLARGKESKVTLSQVLPRIKVLLYPFVIWTVLRFVLIRQWPSSLDAILQPYHFVPLLIQFYFIAPFLVPLAKDRWKLLLIVAAFFHLGIQFYRYMDLYDLVVPGQQLVLALTPRWFFLGQQPFWFPLGLVAGLHVKDIQPRLAALRPKLFAATIVFAVLMLVEYYVAYSIMKVPWQGEGKFNGTDFSSFSRNFYIIAIMFLILSLEEGSLKFPKFVTDLGAKSLGIYMANIPAIYVTALIMYHFIPVLLGQYLLYALILFAAGLGLPILFMWIIRKTPLRVTYRYWFG